MRIGINARILTSSQMRGWNRYTVNLLAELSALGVELVLYSHEPVHAGHLARLRPGSFSLQIAPPMPYVLWEERWLPARAAADGIDLLHSTFNFGLPAYSRCPRVLTVHDAIDEIYNHPRRAWKQKYSANVLQTRLLHWVARTRAHHIITVSEHARREIVDFFGLPAAKVSVTLEAADPEFHRPIADDDVASARERLGLNRPYFFYVGGWEGRKNVEFLVRAFAEARLEGVDLVLAGGKPEEKVEYRKLAAQLGIADSLKLMKFLFDDDLRAVYRAAAAFIYPSRHEGFGLQACEAMAAGCPVLAARATSLPEVVGTGGELFALDTPAELIALMRRVIADEAFRRDLTNRAAVRSGELSWTRTAQQTLAVYHKVLNR